MSEITLLLQRIQTGDEKAAEQLLSLVYDDLRRTAASKISRESPGHTLQATALVHEAWLRLGGDRQPHWQNRAHFFGAAAEAMRRVLIDHARRRQALRHGGDQERMNIDDLDLPSAQEDEQIIAVHEHLDALAAIDRGKAELVKLRYFAALTIEESAEVMGISVATANRWWVYARAWLFKAITQAR